GGGRVRVAGDIVLLNMLGVVASDAEYVFRRPWDRGEQSCLPECKHRLRRQVLALGKRAGSMPGLFPQPYEIGQREGGIFPAAWKQAGAPRPSEIEQTCLVYPTHRPCCLADVDGSKLHCHLLKVSLGPS